MSKKIVRLSSNQVLRQISNSLNANKKQQNQTVEPQTLTRLDSLLCGLEKPCGLFNPFDFEDIENNNFNSFMSTDDNLMMDLLNTPNFDCEAPQIPVTSNENIDDNQVVANSPIDLAEQQKPKRNVSKVFKKAQEVIINISHILNLQN